MESPHMAPTQIFVAANILMKMTSDTNTYNDCFNVFYW